MSPRKPTIPLREIYSVMFEFPKYPGHWTEAIGRFRTKFAAATWAGKKTHTVVVSLIEPGEATSFSQEKTLKDLMNALEEGFR